MASSPHDVMLGNLERRKAQAEAADAVGDRRTADVLWRAVQAHAKSLAPYDPDAAVPALEAAMHRFEVLASEAPQDADLYHRLAQGAAADLAPYRLPKMRVELETDVADLAGAERAAISAELDGLTFGELKER